MYSICILTSVHRALDTRIFHKQARTLAKAGYKVILIAQHDRDEIVDGVTILALPIARNRLQRMMGTWRIFKLALKQKADIYHLHDPELLPWGWLLQRLTGKPVIYDIHENYAEAILFKPWLPHPLRKPIAWITDRTERIIAGRLSAIVTVTDPMKHRFSDCRTPCISIHNFTSQKIAMVVDESDRLNYGKKQHSIICSGGARLSREKVFETALESLDLVTKQDSTATCIILGEIGDLKRLDKIHFGLVGQLSKDGNLTLLGRVPHTEVFTYLNVSKIGWRPEPAVRQDKSIQTRVLEYMAVGIPVVLAADSSLSAEIVSKAKCGILVDPYDAQAHANAILYLLDHPDEAKLMGENGRKAVLEKYNWENEADKLLKLYEMLCQ